MTGETEAAHALVRSYLAGLSQGEISEDLLTPDAQFWSVTAGDNDHDFYIAGIRVLASLFDGGIAYDIQAITAEDDRALAEVRGRGIMLDGTLYENRYVFAFRIRAGRIASVAEHFDPAPVTELLAARVLAALAAS